MADDKDTVAVDEPQVDPDIAAHVNDDEAGMVPRSAMNFVLLELQKLRGLVKSYKAR